MPAATLEKERTYPTGASRWIIVITVVVCALIEILDATIVNVAIPEIGGSIGATTTEIAWIVTIYAIANAIVIPLSGMLSDLFGRKNYFTFSVVLFTFGSLMCGFSTSLWMLIAARFIQGLAGGGLAPVAQSIMIDAFPPKKINTANSIFGIGMMLGPALGPLLGGIILQHLTWHWIFFVNIPIGIIGAILSWLFVSNLKASTKPKKIDWWGILFLATAIGSLVYFFEEGGSMDWFSSTRIIIAAITTLLGAVAFIWRELSTEHPAVNIRLFKDYNLMMGSILTLLLGGILLSGMFLFPLFVRSVYGWTPMKTGMCMMFMSLAMPVGMMLCKKALEKGLKPKISMLIAVVLVVSSMILFSFSTPNSQQSNFLIYLFIEGLGMPFLLLPIMELSFTGYHGSELAQATGLRNMCKKIGGAVGLPLVTIYLSHQNQQVSHGLVQYANKYNPTFMHRLEGIKQSLISAGYAVDEAMKGAYQMMGNIFHQQQTLISYTHTYLTMGILIAVLILPVIFILKGKKQLESK